MTHSYLLRHSLIASAATLLVSTLLSVATAQSSTVGDSTQEQPPQTLGAAVAHLHPETSVSVGAAAQLTASRLTATPYNVLTTGVAPSAAVFATFRQSFKPALGYSVNFSYSRTNDHFTYSPLPGTSGYTSVSNLRVHMYEISVSYIAQQRMTRHVSLFEEAGAGTVAFSAINTGRDLPGRSNTFMPAGVGGVGMDYRLPNGFGLRTQYRGLLTHHPFPDDSNSPKLKTVISTPTLSLTYTFGKHGTH